MANRYRPKSARYECSAHILSPNHKSPPISKPADCKKAAIKQLDRSQRPAPRVVQIFNPVFVTTDVENFPSLVQKLTGHKSRRCRRSLDAHYGRNNRLQEGNIVTEVERKGPDSSTPGILSDDQQVMDRNLVSMNGSRSTLNGSCTLKAGCFSELDIWAGLVSECPLPDITMLPPLKSMQAAT